MKLIIDISEDDYIKVQDGRASVNMMRKAIGNGTPLKQEPKTGEWIPTGYDGYADGNPVYDFWECSECGGEHTGDEETLTPFCPNCGCRMVEPTGAESEREGMSKSTLVIDTPETCGDCPFCIFTAEEKNYIGYCNTSDEDYYCKALDRFMDYDIVEGGLDILGKPTDCPLQKKSEVEK